MLLLLNSLAARIQMSISVEGDFHKEWQKMMGLQASLQSERRRVQMYMHLPQFYRRLTDYENRHPPHLL